MNLLINAESVSPPRTGIGSLTANLLFSWINSTRVNRILGFSGSSSLEEMRFNYAPDSQATVFGRVMERGLGAAFRVADRWYAPYALFHRRRRARFMQATRRVGPEWLYLEPGFILKPFVGPSVPIVHDLSFLHDPSWHPAARVRYLERHLPITLERASHIITPSEVVRKDLMERFQLAPHRITAIHLGHAAPARKPSHADLARVLDPLGLERDRFLLSVATAEPRKNLLRLLQAYEALPPGLRVKFPLVLVGARGWKYNEFNRLRGRLARSGQILQLGFVATETLDLLYRAAALFAFPSLQEGFGLPVLEAMARGTAVLTSRGTAMEEFAGNSVAYCEPRSIDDIRSRIKLLLESPEARSALSEQARCRAEPLTWNRCAEAYLDCFERLLHHAPGCPE
jgi:alpha-1,3-rhamnosyl/mannosyltransferase